MKFLLKIKISILLIILGLTSCGAKKDEIYKLSRGNGYKIDRYSQYSTNSWITVSGLARFTFETEDGELMRIDYNSYKDVYGNCSGSVVATLEESNEDTLESLSSMQNTGTYDVFTPYVVVGTTNISGESVVTSKIFKANVTSISLSGCPFPDYTENYYIVTLYKSGTLIITDWGRSKDYLLVPIK